MTLPLILAALLCGPYVALACLVACVARRCARG
jgi:hypothetical protein